MYSVPEAKIICDSISPDGIRLTTMEVKMHRFVLAEANTHRVWSRNSASSRAIPTSKLIERVMNDPAMPVWWGKNQGGMSAREELSPEDIHFVKQLWLSQRDVSVETAKWLLDRNLHKQLVNRLLEPWMWHTAIVSATEWDNFFAQRCHPDAQPEMREAAMAMQLAYYTSTPKEIKYNEWHLPYLKEEDFAEFSLEELKKISVARCARVSYLSHDGIRDLKIDIEFFDKLVSATPMHASPLEHVATPDENYIDFDNYTPGNFEGWKQLRHFYQKERTKFVPNHPLLINKE